MKSSSMRVNESDRTPKKVQKKIIWVLLWEGILSDIELQLARPQMFKVTQMYLIEKELIEA